VLLFDCWTPPSQRGQGYYGLCICKVAGQLLEQGKRPWIFSAASNRSSLRGIERSGFIPRFSLKRRTRFLITTTSKVNLSESSSPKWICTRQPEGMATATNNIPVSRVVTEGPQLTSSGREFHRRMASISRQSAVYFAGTILTTAAGFFFKVFLARKLGAEALGIYALGMTIVGLLGLFNALGLPTTATRFVAAYNARREFGRLGTFLRGSLSLLSLCNVLLGALLLVVGPWVAVHFYHLPALSSYLWAFALIMFLGVLNTFLSQVMAGYHDVSRRTIITHFIGVPTNILFAVILIGIGFHLRGYLAAQVGSALLIFVLLARSVWKMTPAESRTFGSLAPVEREVVTFSVAAFGTAGLEFVLGQADKILLGRYLDVRQVGIYAVAMALVGFVPIALQSVNQIFSPTISELHATGNHSMLQLLYATLTKWILVLTIPLALTMVVFARPLMGIFGPGFAPGATVLAIGAVGQLLNCAVGSVGFLLLMSGNQFVLVKIQALNAVVLIALGLVLVPRMGMTGAVLATATTVITTNVWLLKAVRTKLELFPYNRSYLKLVLPTLLSAGILVALQHVFWRLHSNWAVALVAMTSSYTCFLAMVWVSGLDSYDREIARMLWAKIGRGVLGNEVNA
jgi:O-antigen/teichoic acid export membrane protein